MYFDPNGGVLATSDRFRCGSRSNFGWNPRRIKNVAGREIVPVAVHKSTQKKENNAFGFFFIIQISQSYCFYLTIYVFTEVCRTYKKKKKKKKEKGLMKLIRSFGNVTDQTEGIRDATTVSWLS